MLDSHKIAFGYICNARQVLRNYDTKKLVKFHEIGWNLQTGEFDESPLRFHRASFRAEVSFVAALPHDLILSLDRMRSEVNINQLLNVVLVSIKFLVKLIELASQFFT